MPEALTVDLVLGHLTSCPIPALEHPETACSLFVDPISRAITAHLLYSYGDLLRSEHPRSRGGLARWQEARVRELIDANLDGSLTTSMLADGCGMSPGHFNYAFKQKLGQSPYQFLIAQRLARAKALMLSTQLPLVEIAAACGFAAQTHFNKRFVAANGMPPGM